MDLSALLALSWEAAAQDSGLRFLFDLYWRASLVLLLAFGLTGLMWRCPAAFRHAVWLGCLTTLALLPAGMLLLPELHVGLRALALLPAGASVPLDVSVVLPLYLCVCAGLFLALLAGLLRLARLTRDAESAGERAIRQLEALREELEISRSLQLRQSGALKGPLSWGWRRPLILLPAAADAWPEAELRQVLVHELAHVERRDWAALLLARAVCLLYWCHPLAWLAARRLEEEAERACDDAVLLAGGDGGDYAGLLLAFARLFAARPPRERLAQPMAQSFLARRLRAILGDDVARAPSEGIHLIRGMLFALPLLLVLATLELVPEFDEAVRYVGVTRLIEVQLRP